MAIIGTIRKRSGLLLILIGVAIAGFVLQDALKSTKGFKYKEIGKVNKTDVTYPEFERKVEQLLEQMKKQGNKENVTPQQTFQAKDQTWNTMVTDILMKKEYDALSIQVTPEEMNDMYYGKFVHSYIAQSFPNKKTGQVDRQQVRNIIDNFDKLKPEEKVQWAQLEDAIKKDRLTNKYNNLISKSYYMPTAFLKRAYNDQMSSKSCRFVAVDYTTVSDSSITLTDKDYQKFYDENKYRYEQQEDSRDIDYVMFEVNPSAEDMQKMTKQVGDYYAELKTATNIPDYINSVSSDRYDSTFFKKGKLPSNIDSVMFSSAVGTVIPPYMDGKYFKMAKLVDIQYRPDSMKASHILVAFQGAYGAQQTVKRTKEEAKKIADSLKNVIMKDPTRLGEIAQAISDDPSAKENKGDMKWFADQQMVGPFNDACLNGKVGDVVVVETIFGYHVVNVTGKLEAEKKVRVGILTYKLEPSQSTYKNVYNTAYKFVNDNTTKEKFEEAIKKQGLNKRTAENVQKMADNIPGIEQARELVKWAYGDDVKKGDVSKQVFEFDNRMFVIAVLKEVRNKGILPLEQIKDNLKGLVIREKKAEMIIAKLSTTLGQTKDLYQIATQYKTAVDTVPQVNFAGSNFGRKGYEPEVIGTIFATKKGGVTKPVKGYSAVYIVMVDAETTAPPAKDYTMVKMQMSQQYQQRVQSDVFRVLKEKADITDNRIYFY